MEQFLNRKTTTSNMELKILIPSILIAIIGIVTLLSTTILPDGTFGDTTVVIKQAIFIIIGYILYFLISKANLSYTKYWQVILPIYIVTIFSLILVLLIGPVINNVQRWIVIGGIQLQPSEFAKIVVVLMTAYILSQKEKYNQWIKDEYKSVGCPIKDLKGHVEFIDNLSEEARDFFHLTNFNSKSDWTTHIVIVIANSISGSCPEYLACLNKWKEDKAINDSPTILKEHKGLNEDLTDLGF